MSRGQGVGVSLVSISFIKCHYVATHASRISKVPSSCPLSLPPWSDRIAPPWIAIMTIPLPLRSSSQPHTVQMEPLSRAELSLVKHPQRYKTYLILTSDHFSVTHIPTITVRWFIRSNRHCIPHLALLLQTLFLLLQA